MGTLWWSPYITCVCRRGFSRMLYCFVPSLFELIFCVRAREYVKKGGKVCDKQNILLSLYLCYSLFSFADALM